MNIKTLLVSLSAVILLSRVALAKDPPPQVTGLKAVHRAGQTFITWNDPLDNFGDKPVTYGQLRDVKSTIRYRVYRHAAPIDAGSLKQAKLLAEVEPLSGFNINGWSFERLVNQALFYDEQTGDLARRAPFNGWSMTSPQGGRLVILRLAIEDNKPLPPGTGLFVNTPAAGKAFYAVTAVDEGAENTQFSGGNNLAEALEEKAEPAAPVEQPNSGKLGFDFRGTRHYFVTWVDPPLAPRPMYFNWSVLVPDDCKEQRPVELYVHGPGMSYARPPTKLIERSIQICPHDFPFSGWYGYNDALMNGKRNDGSVEGGVVHPYTIKRIEAFLKWAQGKFPIDPARVYAVGGDGAAMFALHRPALIAAVYITRFQGMQLDPKMRAEYEKCWGPESPQIKDDAGRPDWSWGLFDVLLCGRQMPTVVKGEEPTTQPDVKYPGTKLNLPLFICCGASWGRDPGYGKGRGRLYYALQATRQGLCADWQWGGKLPAPAKFTGLWRGLDLTNDGAYPSISYSSADLEGETRGLQNLGYSWSEVEEDANSFEVVISGPGSTLDLTPRRLSKFKIAGGLKLDWEGVTTTIPRGSKEPVKQSGQATADENGVVTIKGVQVNKYSPVRIRISCAK